MSLSRLVFFSRNKVKGGENINALIKGILGACSEYSPTSGLTGGLVFNAEMHGAGHDAFLPGASVHLGFDPSAARVIRS